MNILQGGAPKCGNFWLYQIIQQLLQKAGIDTTSFIQKQPIYTLAKDWDLNYPSQASIDVLDVTDLQYSYRISSIYRMPVADLSDYVSQTNHVWTHSPVCKRSNGLFQHFDKKVYIIRDPRDRAISASRYYTSEYMLKYYPQEETDPKLYLEKHFDELMQEWVWHVFDYLRLSKEYNIHICFYEGFLLHFQRELNRLLHYLNIDLSQTEKEDLQDAMRFSTMKKNNPKHLKKGQAGYWTDQLTEEQVQRADVIAGPLIRFLAYPAHAGQEMSFTAAPAHQDFDLLRKELIASQEVLYQA